jgi:cytochrome P450
VLSIIHKHSKTFPGISKHWFGPKLALLLSDAELIKKVLYSSQMLQKPAFFYNVVGLPNGLIESDHSVWQVHRKIINPAFNLKILQSFFPIFVSKTKDMIASLSEKVDGKEFDLLVETMQCTLISVYGRSQ